MDDTYKGHEIIKVQNVFTYKDNGVKVSDDIWRPCGFCGLKSTVDDHDGCIGTLENVMNACCGHGVVEDAYVQLSIDETIRGQDALDYIKNNRGG